jgi:outer membrane lipoprotein SlyB
MPTTVEKGPEMQKLQTAAVKIAEAESAISGILAPLTMIGAGTGATILAVIGAATGAIVLAVETMTLSLMES